MAALLSFATRTDSAFVTVGCREQSATNATMAGSLSQRSDSAHVRILRTSLLLTRHFQFLFADIFILFREEDRALDISALMFVLVSACARSSMHV